VLILHGGAGPCPVQATDFLLEALPGARVVIEHAGNLLWAGRRSATVDAIRGFLMTR